MMRDELIYELVKALLRKQEDISLSEFDSFWTDYIEQPFSSIKGSVSGIKDALTKVRDGEVQVPEDRKNEVINWLRDAKWDLRSVETELEELVNLCDEVVKELEGGQQAEGTEE